MGTGTVLEVRLAGEIEDCNAVLDRFAGVLGGSMTVSSTQTRSQAHRHRVDTCVAHG